MYTTLVSLAVLAAAAFQGAAAQEQDLQLSTPTLVQCQPAQISWGKSSGPYNLIVVPAAAPCDSVLSDLGDHDGTSMTWTVGLAAGQKVLVSVEDANGNEGWTNEITVQPSSDSSCLNAAQLAVASSAAASASASAVASSSAADAAASSAPATILNAGAGVATTHAQATAVGAAGAGVLGGTSNGAAGLAASGALALGGALLATLAMF